ncbi:MAG: class I SAM-dependent methyltransferase [Ignavibacteriaceae bacterium]
MQSNQKIIECYDKTASEYARNFLDELSKKPFDRMVLKNFSQENRNKKSIADFGCGPGQTTKFLKKSGLKNITGIDISKGMIDKAKTLHKGIKFETGDMLNLKYEDNYFDAAIAFYAVVNFTYSQLRKALREINRVLKNNSQFLFSFHIGNKKVHLDSFLDKDVEINFYFFKPEKIFKLLNETGFQIITAAERHPYENIEYPSKRAYILARKI